MRPFCYGVKTLFLMGLKHFYGISTFSVISFIPCRLIGGTQNMEFPKGFQRQEKRFFLQNKSSDDRIVAYHTQRCQETCQRQAVCLSRLSANANINV